MEYLIAGNLQNFGVGKGICRLLGIDPDEWDLDIAAYDWGVRIIKRRPHYHEEVMVYSDVKGSTISRPIFVKKNGETYMYNSVANYRRDVRI